LMPPLTPGGDLYRLLVQHAKRPHGRENQL
jgi:hypothetical protein